MVGFFPRHHTQTLASVDFSSPDGKAVMDVHGLRRERSCLRIEGCDDTALLPIGVLDVLRIDLARASGFEPAVVPRVVLVIVDAKPVRVSAGTGAAILFHLPPSRIARELADDVAVDDRELREHRNPGLLSVVGVERNAKPVEAQESRPR